MRFQTLGGLFSHYHEVRASLESVRTNTPQPEVLREEIFTHNPVKARNALDNKVALIADVQIYLRKIEWYEALTLLGRMSPPGEKQTSWRKLAKQLKELSEFSYCPSKLIYSQNLFNEYRDRIRPEAEHYFRREGYLW